ncbi:hypothetical protein NG799_21615, partial [Laspinema sp. D1]|nr:hypothetical protein [Laspinema sp. D2a]
RYLSDVRSNDFSRYLSDVRSNDFSRYLSDVRSNDFSRSLSDVRSNDFSRYPFKGDRPKELVCFSLELPETTEVVTTN